MMQYRYIENRFHEACQSGEIDTLRKLITDIELRPPTSAYDLQHAAEHGHLRLVNYLLMQPIQHGINQVSKKLAFLGAVKNGHVDVAQALLKQIEVQFLVKDLALDYAAENGYLEIIKLLIIQSVVDNIDKNHIFRRAVKHGHSHIVQFILDHADITEFNKKYSFHDAAKDGYLEIVQMLINQPSVDATIKRMAFNSAIKNGHLNVVQFLSTQPDIRAGDIFIRHAAQNNRFDIVKVLVAQPGFDLDAILLNATEYEAKVIKHALVVENVHQNFFLNDMNDREGSNKDVNKGLLFFKAISYEQVPLLKEVVSVVVEQAAEVTLKSLQQ